MSDSSVSPEQAMVDGIWNELVQAINGLSNHERSTLDTSAIGAVVPFYSTASSQPLSRHGFNDGSSQLRVSHQFIAIALVLSTLADFQLSKPTLKLLTGQFGAPALTGSPPDHYAALARSVIVRDLLLQLNFHGIVASYRPRLTLSSRRLFRSAITFAMAHEAAHVMIGDRDEIEAQSSVHLRSDGTVAESQWGPEAAQDRLAMRLSRSVATMRLASKANSGAVGDHVLSAALVSLVALHVRECLSVASESESHPPAIDRLGSLMFEFNPLESSIAVRRIMRLVPVVDTCLALEPLPVEAWELLSSLVRAGVIHANENRQAAVKMIESAKDSDVVFTARAEYEHIYDYLTSVQGVEASNGKCLDLLRTRGSEALPEVLDLLGISDRGLLEDSAQMTRRAVAEIVESSSQISMLSGTERQTCVDIWANVISAAMREDPDRDYLFYQLLYPGEYEV
ncbi:hypothetical protein AB0D08_14835 [Kitasatospora sp. NPDC048540]|uniref:hypothetical protein n=1 Tax=Kitasatospora sp. NPDC048540 TaxID=3155634 RepID=UPI0033BFE8A2